MDKNGNEYWEMKVRVCIPHRNGRRIGKDEDENIDQKRGKIGGEGIRRIEGRREEENRRGRRGRRV